MSEACEQAEWPVEGSDRGARLRHDGRPRSARVDGSDMSLLLPSAKGTPWRGGAKEKTL